MDDGDGDGDVGLSVPKWHGALRGNIFARAGHPCAAHLIPRRLRSGPPRTPAISSASLFLGRPHDKKNDITDQVEGDIKKRPPASMPQPSAPGLDLAAAHAPAASSWQPLVPERPVIGP